MDDFRLRLRRAVRGEERIERAELFSAIGAKDSDELLAGEALEALARFHPADAEPLARRWLHDPNSFVRDHAASALAVCHGLEPIWEISDAIHEAVPWEDVRKLSDPVRHVRVLAGLDVQVDNGGFSQYFCNGYGEMFRDVLSMCRAIGADETLGIVLKALAIMGVYESTPDEDAFETLEAGQSAAEWEPLRVCDSAFYRDDDHRVSLMAEYMLRHKDALWGLGRKTD